MKQVKELLVKEMTRKEFLQVAGMAMLTMLGVSNFLTFLLHNQKPQISAAPVANSHGFGSRSFGS